MDEVLTFLYRKKKPYRQFKIKPSDYHHPISKLQLNEQIPT